MKKKQQKILQQILEIGESALKVSEALSPTERTKRYNERHPKKVLAHLRKTTKDRVERNRARRKAESVHGKAKMKHHDVHHVYGTKKKITRIVEKDHGPGHK